jgi:hypothetical protein
MYLNQEYSKLSIEEKPQNEIIYESLQSKESNNLPIDDKYSENINTWYYIDYPKSNDKIKNFITFLKLIDEKVN